MCIYIHTYAHAHAHSNHAYAYLGNAHAYPEYAHEYPEYAHASRVSKTMKGRLFSHKFMWNLFYIIWEPPTLLFYHYIK